MSKSRLERDMIYRLSQMAKFGQSKHEAKQQARADYLKTHGDLRGYNPSRVDGIFSHETMRTYRAAAHDLCRWAAENGIKREKQLTPEICREYLQQRDQACSAWTVSRDMAMLNKCYNYGLSKDNCELRERRLEDITRSRGQTLSDSRDFDRYADQIFMSRGCGMRRQSVCAVTPESFKKDEKGLCYAVCLVEKGAKFREAPILTEYKERITELVDTAQARENGSTMPIFNEYNRDIDNHALRREYAQELLREIEAGEQKGLKYQLSDRDAQGGDTYRGHDKIAMAQVSFALG